jgi:putative DNA methylase
MCVVVKSPEGRAYLSPDPYSGSIGLEQLSLDAPFKDIPIEHWAGCTNCVVYGMETFASLYTARQLATLQVFSARVKDIWRLAYDDAICNPEDSFASCNALNIANSVAIYMTLAIGKLADLNNSMCRWEPRAQCPRNLFGKQAIPMVWDYAEANPFSTSSGSWKVLINGIANAYSKCIDYAAARRKPMVKQADVCVQSESCGSIISTDPPYYDNVPYSNLSDFFYLWHRQSLGFAFPELYATLSVPRGGELVATASRHGGKSGAESYFLEGMKTAFSKLACDASPGYPIVIYYAFKQSESSSGNGGRLSTGWQVFLEAIISAGLAIKSTWPINTENSTRMMGQDLNSLSSSIVLSCYPRPASAETISRQEFRRALKACLASFLRVMESSGIAPVDIAQAAIGPGMSIYSSAKTVLNPDDSPMTVREALIEISTILDEALSQDEGELDPDSRFALTFFESFGYAERDFGDAEGLAKARNVSVEGVAKAGILRSVAGKVLLLQRVHLEDDWDPNQDDRLCVWEATQHLIKRLEAGGEGAAAELLGQLKKVAGHGDLAANCRALAYRLYNHCEKTKQAEEARAYNGLVIAWPELERLASNQPTETAVQASLI